MLAATRGGEALDLVAVAARGRCCCGQREALAAAAVRVDCATVRIGAAARAAAGSCDCLRVHGCLRRGCCGLSFWHLWIGRAHRGFVLTTEHQQTCGEPCGPREKTMLLTLHAKQHASSCLRWVGR